MLWLLAVGAVLALIARHLTASEEWRAFRWDHLWKIFRQVYLGFLLAAVAVSLSTYLLRALRWRSFLEHIVHVPLKTLVAGQFIGFSTVYLIGRAGELVRPAYVARRGGVPFVSMAAVWLLERVYDSVFIFLILGLGLSLGGIDPTRPQDNAFIRALEISSRGLLFLLLILIVGLIYFQMKAEGAISHLSSSKPIPLLSERRKKWLLGVAESFSIGLGTIGKGQALLSSLGYSILVWTANVSVFWLVAQGLGGRSRPPHLVRNLYCRLFERPRPNGTSAGNRRRLPSGRGNHIEGDCRPGAGRGHRRRSANLGCHHGAGDPGRRRLDVPGGTLLWEIAPLGRRERNPFRGPAGRSRTMRGPREANHEMSLLRA